MTATFLLWLAMITVGVQTAPPLSLDIRVFNGAADVTRETTVTVFDTGTRTNGRPVPYLPSGERQLPLPPGQYDLQLVRHQDGKVSGIAWSTLRLLVAYPGEAGRHLEVVNFAKDWGALQVRPERQSQSAAGTWSSRLLRKDGSEVARGVSGSGYQVLVAPAGAYDMVVEAPGLSPHRQAVEVKANLTYVRTF
jgi:hypothetical protein